MPEGSPQSAIPASNPPLVDVASQIASTRLNPTSSQPEVVFVGKNQSPRKVEVTVGPRKKADESVERVPPRQDDQTTPAETATLSQSSEARLADPFPQVVNRAERAEPESQETRFAFDPFALGIDGPIPAMPTLPIVEAIEMTQNVVSREKAGTHYAWRLKPGPYPDLGNSPEVQPGEECAAAFEEPPHAPHAPHVPQFPNGQAASSTPDVQSNDVTEQTFSQWSEMEVVSESNFESLGDNFVVQPGEVISIDGNQGYDHIDLRSYSIADATFQPGAILLNSELSGTVPDSDEKTPATITIRHRGVGFAIFKGEVRVEL